MGAPTDVPSYGKLDCTYLKPDNELTAAYWLLGCTIIRPNQKGRLCIEFGARDVS